MQDLRLVTLSEAQWRQYSAKAVVQTLKSMQPCQKTTNKKQTPKNQKPLNQTTIKTNV